MKRQEDWQIAFRSNVMRTSLVLSLTQPMLQFLCATADGVTWDRRGASTNACPDNSIASSRSLEKRGLIRRRPKGEFPRIGDTAAVIAFCDSSCWALTPAGEAVVDLLRAVGLFVESDRAIARKAAT